MYLRRPAARPPFPVGADGVQVYAFARQGVWHGARALGLAGTEVLVPAYHHGSEVEALRDAGATCVFYGGGDGVHPDADELEERRTERTRALYLVHALGLPQDAPRWRRWCDDRGLLLLEDAAQAWLATVDGEPVGSWGDLAVWCAYKTVALSEGAFVRAPTAAVPPAADNPSRGALAVARRHGVWLAQRSGAVSAAAERLGMTYRDDPAAELDLRLDKTGPWTTTGYFLDRLADPGVASVRRAHYRLLLDALGDAVPAAFAELPDGASPFAFPLAVPDKPAALTSLAALGVRALSLWSTGHPSLPAERFPAVDELRRSVVGLPVHQDLRPRDVEAVAAAGARVARTARRRRPPRVERVAGLLAGREVWEDLAGRAGHPFATWQWAHAWQEAGEPGSEPVVALFRDEGGRPAGVVALERSRLGGLRTARFWASRPADLGGPVCAPRDAPLAASALRVLLDGLDDVDVLLAERLPGGVGWPVLLGTRRASHEASPAARLPAGGWDAYLAGRSANLRQQVRRRERRLRERPGTRFRLADASSLEQDLDDLFRLHALRWPDGSDFLRLRPFHERFARAAAERGWLRLWLLDVEDVPVAAWYGFRYGGDEWYYQAGRDPAADDLHVGAVLLAHTLRAAADDGQRRYRFLRGDEPFKQRFATQDDGTDLAVVGRGPRGRAGAAAVAVAAALPPATRARLGGASAVGSSRGEVTRRSEPA